jgi:hypothetical protein
MELMLSIFMKVMISNFNHSIKQRNCFAIYKSNLIFHMTGKVKCSTVAMIYLLTVISHLFCVHTTFSLDYLSYEFLLFNDCRRRGYGL